MHRILELMVYPHTRTHAAILGVDSQRIFSVLNYAAR